MVKYTKQEQEEAMARLRGLLRPGIDVAVKVDHVAPSGMTRWIECYVVDRRDRGDHYIRRITRDVAVVTGYPFDTRNHRGVEVGGCGMDMGFHLVYSLSRVMFRDGFRCAGKSCGSNDHVNSRGDGLGPMPRDGKSKHRGDGGYALNHRWI